MALALSATFLGYSARKCDKRTISYEVNIVAIPSTTPIAWPSLP